MQNVEVVLLSILAKEGGPTRPAALVESYNGAMPKGSAPRAEMDGRYLAVCMHRMRAKGLVTSVREETGCGVLHKITREGRKALDAYIRPLTLHCTKQRRGSAATEPLFGIGRQEIRSATQRAGS